MKTLLVTWSGLELRRRWRSLVVLALLVGFATMTVLAAVAGARRADTAVERLLTETLPADAVVLPNQPGFDWDAVRALPQVETLAEFPVSGFWVDGVDEDGVDFPPAGVELMRTIERPVVIEGRMLDFDRVDEVVVTPKFPHDYGKGVGDTVTLRLATPEQMDVYQTDLSLDEPSGPVIRARIVGVIRSGWFGEDVGSKGRLVGSPAVFDRYPANIVGAKKSVYINAMIRLRGGESALPEFRKDLAQVSGRSDIDVWNMADKQRHAQKVNAFEAACLLAFGLAALAAAMVLIGQSVARYTAATAADLRVIRGLGMTPREAMLAASVGPFAAAVAGATLGVAGAVAVSHWMPIGAAALVEPDPGVHVDWTVLGAGWVLAPLAVLATAGAAAWFALSPRRDRTSPRRSAVAVSAARAGLPAPVVVGARFALEPGRGRSAVPVRPAIFGAVTGVLGVLAALTFSAGVSDAAENPARFGQTHQLDTFLGFNGEDFAPTDKILGYLARDPDVAAVNDARNAVAEAPGGSVAMYTLDPVGKQTPVVLTAGTLPTTGAEVVLAPTSAKRLGAEIGSTVRFSGNRKPRALRVTGIGFVPLGSHNGYDEGGWLTTAGYDALFTGFKFHTAQITLRPGADTDAVLARLQKESAADLGQPIPMDRAATPPQLAEIQDVRELPIALGAFLALLAVGAVGHALATAVRRRRYEVAVLRAVGMTRTQSRVIVVTQATLLAGIGLLFGVPLGLALGRTLWRLVADNTPLYYQPPLAFFALLLAAPVAVLVANLLAAWPGHRAARLRIGSVLRTE